VGIIDNTLIKEITMSTISRKELESLIFNIADNIDDMDSIDIYYHLIRIIEDLEPLVKEWEKDGIIR